MKNLKGNTENKNFDEWNISKKEVNNYSRAPVRLGEIYWCKLGMNIGVEQDGRSNNFERPVIIIKKFSDKMALVAPLTTMYKKGDWYMELELFGRKQQIILNQIKPVDTKRLLNSMGEISLTEVNNILLKYIKLIIS